MLLSADQLAALEARLRAAGFKIGPSHRLDATQVIEHLQRTTTAPADNTARGHWLAAHLAPIYSAEPAQQGGFAAHVLGVLGAAAEPAQPPPDRRDLQTPRPWRAWVTALLLALCAVGGLGTGVWWLRAQPLAVQVLEADGTALLANVGIEGVDARRPTGPPEGRATLAVARADLPITLIANRLDDGSQASASVKTWPDAPVVLRMPARTPTASALPAPSPSLLSQRFDVPPAPGQPASQSVQLVPRWVPSHLALLALPLLAVAAWALGWQLKRHAWLARLPADTPWRLREVSVQARRELALAIDPGPAVHELRRRRWQASAELNVEASLRATLAAGGAPRLLYGSRLEPDYLALIDEGSTLDHLARLADELMLALQGRDVSLQRYFFRDTPQWCEGPASERRPRALDLPAVALEALHGRYPQHRLIVVSDGRPMFNMVTGEPQPWVDTLLQWAEPVLMTPAPVAAWGHREWALSQLGFTVLPLGADGLLVLGGLVGSDLPAPAMPQTAAGRPAPPWVRAPRSLQQPQPPQGQNPAALVHALRTHLGADACLWLQACAVYPEIHWAITLRLGAALFGTGPRPGRALVPLVRLPWLRDSHMPNWLRQALLDALANDDWRRVHKLLQDILSTVAEPDRGDLLLQIATTPKLPLRPTPPGRRPRRDAVFLRFMQGPPQLAVPAADALRRLFFRDGLWSMGLRVAPLLALAGVLALGLGVLWPPRADTTVVQLVPARAAPAVSALAVSGTASAPSVWVGYADGGIRRSDGVQTRTLTPAAPQGIEAITVVEDGARLFLVGATQSSRRTLSAQGEAIAGPAESVLPGRLIVSADGRLSATVYEAERQLELASRRLTLPGGLWPLRCAGWHAGGGLVLVGEPGTLALVDAQGGLATRRLQQRVDGCTVPTGADYVFGWHNPPPLAAQAASAVPSPSAQTPLLWRLSVKATQAEQALNLQGPARIAAATASADGRTLYLARSDAVELHDGQTGALLASLPGASTRLASSADGRLLALAGADGQVALRQREDATKPARPTQRVLLSVSQQIPGDKLNLQRLHMANKALADLLAQRFGYRVVALRDASRVELDKALAELTSTLEPEDQVILHFSGIGGLVKQGGIDRFQMPLGGYAGNQKSVLDANALRAALDALPARNVLVIAEASYARGLLDADRTVPRTPGRSRWLLSDADRTAQSRMVPGATPTASLLTNALLKTLGKASGTVTLQALKPMLDAELDNASLTTPVRFFLDPMLGAGHEGGDFVFTPLAQAPPSASTANPPGPQAGTAKYAGIIAALAEKQIEGTRAAAQLNQLLAGERLQDAIHWVDCAKNVRAVGDELRYDGAGRYPQCAPIEKVDSMLALVDFVKRNPAFRNYQYTAVAIQRDAYAPGHHGARKDDLVVALEAAITVLRGRASPAPFSLGNKAEALRLLVTLVADLHRPLHVGAIYLDTQGRPVDPDTGTFEAASDTGGANRLRLDAASGASNLHALWDAAPRQQVQLATLQASDPGVPRTTGAIEEWPVHWATENLLVARAAFEGLRIGRYDGREWPVVLPAGYLERMDAVKQQQLARGGSRLAQLLTAIWP